MPPKPKLLPPETKKFFCNGIAAAWAGMLLRAWRDGAIKDHTFRSACTLLREWVDDYSELHTRSGQPLLAALAVSRQYAQSVAGAELANLVVYIAGGTDHKWLGDGAIEEAIAADTVLIAGMESLLLGNLVRAALVRESGIG